MAKTLGTRAIQQAQADHRWVKRQRRRPRTSREKYSDDRQPFVLVCLIEDLSASAAARGWMMRRDAVTGLYSTSSVVEVYGDADLHAESDPTVRAGDSVIAGWLHGRWRAIRRAGVCASVSSSFLNPSGVLVLKDVSFGNCGFTKELVEVVAC